MKKIIITIVIIALLGLGVYYFTKPSSETVIVGNTETKTPSTISTTTATIPSKTTNSNAPETVIGQSVQNRDITAYHFGTGSTEILFVGGIHGGYEWNTSLVSYELMDYLKSNPNIIPSNLKVTVIPVLNPDGLAKVTGTEGRFTASQVSSSASVQVAGRFNGNTVDLNRNFDCDWKSSGVWQSKTVSGGTSPFSEPESLALKNYVEAHVPAAAVVWYSAAGGVYASSCGGDVMAETSALTKAYATASGYPAHEDFDSYKLTGDMVNWFAKKEIPAISVLLTNHTNTEWTKNKAGIDAVLKRYAR